MEGNACIGGALRAGEKSSSSGRAPDDLSKDVPGTTEMHRDNKPGRGEILTALPGGGEEGADLEIV